MKAETGQAVIPKSSLPDCEVGETLKIVGEDDSNNFIVEPEYEAADDKGESSEGEPAAEGGKSMPGMSRHAPAIAIVIGGRGGKGLPKA